MPAQSTKKILIAEDEKPIANALKLKLSSAGYQVEVAYDGAIAIERLTQEHFDLMLLDLIMPGKNGFEVLNELNTLNLKIPVIITSNLGQPEDKEKAKSLGAIEFVVKSDTPLADIVNLVNNVLGKD